MFNLGFSEFLVIGVIALLVIGPKQLPEVARVVGHILGELHKATHDLSGGLMQVRKQVQNSIDETREEIVAESRKIKDSIMESGKDPDEETVSDKQNDRSVNGKS